jgi:hypothetical protein
MSRSSNMRSVKRKLSLPWRKSSPAFDKIVNQGLRHFAERNAMGTPYTTALRNVMYHLQPKIQHAGLDPRKVAKAIKEARIRDLESHLNQAKHIIQASPRGQPYLRRLEAQLLRHLRNLQRVNPRQFAHTPRRSPVRGFPRMRIWRR